MAANTTIEEILKFIDETELPELDSADPAPGDGEVFRLPTDTNEQGFVNCGSVQSYTPCPVSHSPQVGDLPVLSNDIMYASPDLPLSLG